MARSICRQWGSKGLFFRTREEGGCVHIEECVHEVHGDYELLLAACGRCGSSMSLMGSIMVAFFLYHVKLPYVFSSRSGAWICSEVEWYLGDFSK